MVNLFCKRMGLYLSKKESWKDEYYKKALEDERFGLHKDWYEIHQNGKHSMIFFQGI